MLLAAVLCTTALAAPASFPDIGPGDHLERGIKAYRDGDMDRAKVELKRAIGLDSRLVAAHYHLAKIHLIAKDVYRAFYSLREVIALEPSNQKARKLLAELTGELLGRVQADIKARRNVAVAYNVMGFLLIAQNRLEAGVKREQFALELDPKMAEAYDDLAWAAYKDRDLERAFEMASKAFELDPVKGSISAHYQQLFNLRRLGGTFAAGKKPVELANAAVSDMTADAVSGHPPVDAGLSPVVRPPGGVRASDLEAMVGEDDSLVRDYLKNASMLAAAPPAPAPVPKASAPAAGPDDAVRKKKVAEEAKKALEENYALARKKEDAKDFAGALQIYQFIYSTDRGYQDVAARISDIKRMAEAVTAMDDAVMALKTHRYGDALEQLQSIDRASIQRARDIKSLDNLLGEAAFGSHNWDLAKVHLKKWLETHDDAAARFMLVKTLQAVGDWPAVLDEATNLMNRHKDATTRWPELYTLKTKAWVKSYFAVVLVLAFLWGSLSSGYVYVKLKRGSAARTKNRVIDLLSIAVKKEKWSEVLQQVEKMPDLPFSRAEDVFIGVSTGMGFLCTGELAKATKIQREMLAAYPDEPSVHHLTARIMLSNRDFSEGAIEEYHRLLSVEPNNRALLEALNNHYQARAPESDEAMKILDRLLELDPTNTDFRYYRGLRHLRQKDFGDVAKNAYVRVLEVDPARADVRYGLARCHFEARNYLEAIKEAKRAMETDLRNAELHKILLTSYGRLSMKTEAVKEYRQLVARHPEMPELRSYLDQIESLKGTDSGEEQTSREAEALYEKGLKLAQEGRHRDAIGPLTAAFNVDQYRMSAGTFLVRSYLKVKEVDTAILLFEKLDVPSAKRPDDFLLGLCYDMADVYLKENKKAKALELYKYICRADPGYRDAFSRMEELQASVQA